MRKVFLLFVSIAIVGFTSCSKEDILGKDAKVKVKVTKFGIPQNGETVYMFDSLKKEFFRPFFAKDESVTENGVATFYIGAEKFGNKKQKAFYFAIFKGGYYYKVATNIEKSETKTVEINY